MNVRSNILHPVNIKVSHRGQKWFFSALEFVIILNKSFPQSNITFKYILDSTQIPSVLLLGFRIHQTLLMYTISR